MLPTPDFSMMYNVITLTCTLLTTFFGSMVGINIRRIDEVYKDGEFVSDRPLARFYRFIAQKCNRGKNTPVTEAPSEDS